MTGGGPASGPSAAFLRGSADGRHRPSAQPATPARATTTGNGTPNTASARKEATASRTSAWLSSAFLATRMTACTTIASTAAASPAKTDVTTVVVPKAT